MFCNMDPSRTLGSSLSLITSTPLPFSGKGSLLRPLEVVYLLGLGALAMACEAVFPLSPWRQKLPFLPLLVTSVYCSVGVCYSFLRLYVSLLRGEEKPKQP